MTSRDHITLNLTVDLVILTVREDLLQVLVVERANEPFRGWDALPGGFLREGEGLRKAPVRELGADTIAWHDAEQVVAAARRWAGTEGPPVVFDATGAAAAVQAMITMVARAGRAVQVGMSNDEAPIRVGILTEKELDLLGVSCCGASEFAEAVAVVERNGAQLARLISHEFGLDETPEAVRFAMSNPAPATRRASRGRPATSRGSSSMATSRCLAPLSVSVASAAAGRGRRLGRSGRRPGHGHFMPHPTGRVEPVALVLSGSGVGDIGVQRVPVVGGLLRAVGAGDRAQRAHHA